MVGIGLESGDEHCHLIWLGVVCVRVCVCGHAYVHERRWVSEENEKERKEKESERERANE